MEADESLSELVTVKSPSGQCHTESHPCYYMEGQPGDHECGRHNTPCKGYAIIFVPKLEYLTWKLTQT